MVGTVIAADESRQEVSMKRIVRTSAFWALSAVIAVSALGQDRAQWRTAADIREGIRGSAVGTVVETDEARREITIATDDDRYQQITVRTDSVATQYNGFGGVINGSPEIFKGSKGLSNVRSGDRIEVRGTGRGTGIVMADQITLLGRSVPASTTGVGETRQQTSVSTPTASTAGASQDVFGRVEGVIRQINANDNRITVETDRREIFNVRTSSTTPVYYKGDVYQVRNLEVGDRIRVESDDSTLSGREIRARVIDVIEGVQDRSTSTDRRIGSLAGRVTRVDRGAEIVRIDTGREEVRIDTSRANDSAGRRIRASDIQVGDRLEVTGSYAPSSDLFRATTIRFSEDVFSPTPERESENEMEDEEDQETADYVAVTISGTVAESLQNSATLVVRDRASGRNIHVFVTEDFVVRNKTGGYMTADKLAENDPVMIKAFRDDDGNYVAQTIRIR